MKKMFKKLATVLLSQILLFAGMGAMPILAQWPDEGYVHVPGEDLEFTTSQEAVDYAYAHGWDIYNKYNSKVEFSADYNSNGKFTLKWYVYGATSSTSTTSTSASTTTTTTTSSPQFSQDEIDFTVGYTYLSSEDVTFTNASDAYSYCQAEGWNMYGKYSKPVKFYVAYIDGKYVAHWYKKA